MYQISCLFHQRHKTTKICDISAGQWRLFDTPFCTGWKLGQNRDGKGAFPFSKLAKGSLCDNFLTFNRAHSKNPSFCNSFLLSPLSVCRRPYSAYTPRETDGRHRAAVNGLPSKSSKCLFIMSSHLDRHNVMYIDVYIIFIYLYIYLYISIRE